MAKNTSKKTVKHTAPPLFGKLMQKNNLGNKTSPNWKDEYLKIAQMQQKNEVQLALKAVLDLYKKYPDNEHVQNLTAVILAQNHRYQDAINILEKINNKLSNPSVQNNIALIYQKIGEYQKAHAHLEQALSIDPNHIDSLLNMGVTKSRLQRSDQAVIFYDKVLSLQPNHKIALSNFIFHRHYVMPADPQYLSILASKLGQLYQQDNKILPPAPKPQQKDKRLHIGIVSADLHNHPVGYFIEGLLTSDEIKQFTWSAYANSPISTELTERIRPTFTHWHQIDGWSDERVVNQIRIEGVDILIDLSGLTGGARMGVFASQAAPVQLTWLGYFGTTGLSTMQGIIADNYCVPREEETWFSEKVWKLPHTRLCFSAPKKEIAVSSLPALTNGYVTFGCFQSLAKVNDQVLSAWAKIAQQLPQARWRFQGGKLSEQTEHQAIKERLIQKGFNEEQLAFYSATSREEYFVAHNQIDIILDTFPYPGGTTTTEALWMGVPTITLALPGMLARQGQQLLSAAGLADWVTTTEESYIEKALFWGNAENYAKLNQLRISLREQVLVSPLFDNTRFAQDWCLLIKNIWQDACI